MSIELNPKELEEVMVECAEHLDDMSGRDYEFFSGNFERWKRFGVTFTLSPAQSKWLMDIHARYVTGSGSQRERRDDRVNYVTFEDGEDLF